jgi:hypothetical protein
MSDSETDAPALSLCCHHPSLQDHSHGFNTTSFPAFSLNLLQNSQCQEYGCGTPASGVFRTTLTCLLTLFFF